MGLFDKMFGRGAAEAEQQQGAQQRFNELKQKYQTVLTTADNERIQFLNLHVQDNKLFIRGIAPFEDQQTVLRRSERIHADLLRKPRQVKRPRQDPGWPATRHPG